MQTLRQWWNRAKKERQQRKFLKKKYFELSKAIQAKDSTTVQRLLDEGAHPNFNPDGLGKPWPAQLALESGDVKIFKMMLDAGMNPNFIARSDYTTGWEWESLLFSAISKGKSHEDIAMALLDHPDLDIKRSGAAFTLESASQYPSPIKLAQSKGMDRVVWKLAKLNAALKRAEADELDKIAKQTSRRLASARLNS